jgi:hypothetical protein
VVERAGARRLDFGWRSWFLFGVVGGGTLFALAAGGDTLGDGYGWLRGTGSAATPSPRRRASSRR